MESPEHIPSVTVLITVSPAPVTSKTCRAWLAKSSLPCSLLNKDIPFSPLVTTRSPAPDCSRYRKPALLRLSSSLILIPVASSSSFLFGLIMSAPLNRPPEFAHVPALGVHGDKHAGILAEAYEG